ncbi:SDR family oxidoreductase [Nocardioides marmorisolisilvae]|uniref:SDR family oxidoreductase n=1 Tax=Nocardioides marmorisolisilvae TaxID=1542737 RepID=A0A3N0DUU8_9ACTN|nr:SDR family oxidoreductase [Nocardioides marmorisolisilvae]RNL79405.1 SDR family oxidoreductase [Nocardioides marmorisolisilvae]
MSPRTSTGVEGKVFLVTGGTGGLGLATAEQLVADGARVVVSGRSSARVDAAVASLGGKAVGIVADNGDPESAARLVAAAVEGFGRLDGALISVGGPPTGTVMGTEDETWRSAFDSVFVGSVRIARAVADAIEGHGSIAFVLSSSVRAPLANLAVSNGLRPGLAMVAKTLADELGPRGIRVNGLLPGRIGTDRVAELDAATGDAAAAKDAAVAGIPLSRYGEPAEFGQAAAFLLSERSSFVTGVMLPVDGGMLRAL